MALWTPANLTTIPIDWFKSDVGVTGSPVDSIANQGSHTGVLQIGSTWKPTITDTLNGLPVLGFDGVDDILESDRTYSYPAGPYHVFIVQKRSNTLRYDNHFRVGSSWSTTSGMSTQWRDNDDFEFFGKGYGPIYFGTSTGPAGSIYTSSASTDTYWHIIEVKFASTPAVWFDGNAQTLDESYTGFDIPSMTSTFMLGSNDYFGENFKGNIAEFILLSYTPTDADRQRIEGYLAWKWGNTGTTATDLVNRLPSGHTYKSAAPTTAPSGVTGTASITEAGDTLSSATKLALKASVAITEGGDTISSATKLALKASSIITEAGDTLTSANMLDRLANVAITESNDTLSSASYRAILASFATTDIDDTVSSTSALSTHGVVSIFEEDDQISSTSSFQTTATLDTLEDDDTLSSTFTILGSITTIVNILEGDDVLTSNFILERLANANVIEEDDISDGTSTLSIKSAASITEADDTVQARWVPDTFAQLNVTENNDTLVMTIKTLPYIIEGNENRKPYTSTTNTNNRPYTSRTVNQIKLPYKEG